MVENFERVVVAEIKAWVQEIEEAHTGNWEEFKKALKEFERKYSQLSTREHQILKIERAELFLQAIDLTLQRSLEVLFEDRTVEQGLKT